MAFLVSEVVKILTNTDIVIDKSKLKPLIIKLIIGAFCAAAISGGGLAYGQIQDYNFDKKLSEMDLLAQNQIGQKRMEIMQNELNDVKINQSQEIASLKFTLNETAQELEEQKVDWSSVSESIIPAVVKLYDYDGGFTGSGIIISEDGLIVTNAHVIDYDEDKVVAVAVTDSAQAEPVYKYLAYVAHIMEDRDVAVLAIYNAIGTHRLPSSFDYFDVSDNKAKDVQIGDDIAILGYPGIGGDTITLTTGEVSGFDIGVDGDAVIKTSASIMPGNSGGIAFDKNGKMIGIPTYTWTASTYSESMGYIIDISE